MKIFTGLHNIAGYYHHLQKGFLELGIQCDVFDLNQKNSFYTHSPFPSKIATLIINLSYIKKKLKKKFFIAAIPVHVLEKSLLLVFFFECLIKYDVFIFSYGSTFFFYLDLPILKFFNKRIIHIFHGDDIRPPYISGNFYYTTPNLTPKKLYKKTKNIKRTIHIIEKYADYIISSPFISQFLTKPYINWFTIGIPKEFSDLSLQKKQNKTNKFTILHAPSFPEIKGTHTIRNTIQKLIAKGHNINYIELTNRKNTEVTALIQRADLVIDQLYSECFWSTIATEAAGYGTPTLVCGNAPVSLIHDHLPKNIPHGLYTTTTSFEKTLESILNRTMSPPIDELKNFIRDEWTCRHSATRLLAVIKGEVNINWCDDPYLIKYIHGGACPFDILQKMTTLLIDTFGEKSLQLEEKPLLKAILIQFIKES